MPAVLRRKRQMVENLVKIHLHEFEASGTELVMGEGRFVEPKTVEVALNAGGTRLIRGERVFLDVGTRGNSGCACVCRADDPRRSAQS